MRILKSVGRVTFEFAASTDAEHARRVRAIIKAVKARIKKASSHAPGDALTDKATPPTSIPDVDTLVSDAETLEANVAESLARLNGVPQLKEGLAVQFRGQVIRIESSSPEALCQQVCEIDARFRSNYSNVLNPAAPTVAATTPAPDLPDTLPQIKAGPVAISQQATQRVPGTKLTRAAAKAQAQIQAQTQPDATTELAETTELRRPGPPAAGDADAAEDALDDEGPQLPRP